MSTNQPRGKSLLPFSVTPPRPLGPSEAEKKMEALSPELENEMDLRLMMHDSLATNESAVFELHPRGQPEINKESSECIIQKLKVELMIVRAELESAKNMLQMSEQENYKMKLIIDHLRNRVTEMMNIDGDVEIWNEDIFQTDTQVTSAAKDREKEELVTSKQEADVLVLGQMDPASKIFDFLYLGSEWNASNLEELTANGVTHILNVTREIDNFFPAVFKYLNIREWDVEETDLLQYWNLTYRFIRDCMRSGGVCLVHCKMGISRSASTVMSFAMKHFSWSLEQAMTHTKERRKIIYHPNH